MARAITPDEKTKYKIKVTIVGYRLVFFPETLLDPTLIRVSFLSPSLYILVISLCGT